MVHSSITPLYTDFPKLMNRIGDEGFVVLFYTSAIGTVLRAGRTGFTVGKQKTWNYMEFEDYNGEITLSNAKNINFS